jgi:SIR2-like domain/TIR domain
VESAGIDEKERHELRILVEQIKSDSGCVLVLGPRIAVRANDPTRRPLSDILSAQLYANLNDPGDEIQYNLRHVADLYYRYHQNRVRLELEVQDFYRHEMDVTTDLHRQLARLPFRLCISASPDNLMLTAFKEANKQPKSDHYRFKGPPQLHKAGLVAPTVVNPLVYYLFGYFEDRESLVLTEADLIDFLVRIIANNSPVPDAVRSILRDRDASFLFIGFGFENWYLRVLLKVLDVYGHRDNAIAFEDSQFFDLPESRHAIAFFSGERRIEFRHLRWELFAQQLLKTYEETLPRPNTTPEAKLGGRTAPLAFLSYASEDVETVNSLAQELRVKGVDVWQDRQKLRAGDNWNEVLLTIIKKKVDYVIVVQTHAMSTAISGVFHREIQAAQQRQAEMGRFEGQRLRFLVPVTIGRGDLLSPLNEELHTVDVGTPAGVDLLVKSILEDWENREKLGGRPRRRA